MKGVFTKISALGLIGACFAVSLGMRLMMSGPALGQEIAQALAGEETSQSAPVKVTDTQKDLLLEAIREREAELDAEAARIEERRRILEEAEAAYSLQLKALQEAEAKLASTLAVADTAALEDIKRLTAVYETMKSKDAAKIFDTMDARFAAGFLSRMAPTSAAEILADMATERAHLVSVVMAGQNANTPPEFATPE
ncbi:MAG: hypothetical protein AAFR93_03260 [Pseudomonadota bacterium]